MYILVFQRFKEFFPMALIFLVEESTSLEFLWEVLFDHWKNLFM